MLVRTACAAILALLVLGFGAVPVSAADEGPIKRPRCWGAASHDPANPCRNPELRLSVFPKPADAVLAPYSPCTPLQRRPLYVCGFRDVPEDPVATIALIGDSHASHWRVALEAVARDYGWRGVSIARSGCPLTQARRNLDPPRQRGCMRWNERVHEYLRDHPEIETVFVSQNAGAGVKVPSNGVNAFTTEVSGYQRAWKKLPASVKRVVVIRDTPRNTSNSAACVSRAIARRVPAGTACAVPRSYAVRTDRASIAAKRLRSPRYGVVDLTRFFCSNRLCPPVIGGVLVHKDVDHITTQFSESLGPFLLRHVKRLLSGS